MIASLLTVFAIVLVIGTIGIVILAIHASPIMLTRPLAAVDRARGMLTAACNGDYETASGMMYGNPNLGTPPEDSSPAVDLLWDAFLESLEYALSEDCYASDSGVAMDVTIRYLDISGVMNGLDSRAQTLLNQRIAMAEDSAEIYDEENNFRQEIITEVLRDATSQALEENRQYREQTIPLHLVFDQGEWWVMPDADLLNVLAGSISG